MTHEPECWHPDWIVNDPSDPCHVCTVIQQGWQRGFVAGYNAHATDALRGEA